MDEKKFGLFVAEMRKEKGMTQAALADLLKVTDKAVSRWERGLGFPDINTIEPLAEALGLTIHELMKQEKSVCDTITKEDANEAVGNTLTIIEVHRKKMAKRLFKFMAVFVVTIMVLYMIVTGTMKREDVFMLDYSVTEHTGVVTMQVGVAGSMGYIREMRDISDNPARAEMVFYSTFGGLNSSWGAETIYTFQPGEQCKEIYFRTYDGWRLVLEKDSNGEWIKAE